MTAQEFTEYVQARANGADMLAQVEKLGFSPGFIATHVLTGTPVTIAHVAMQWMGMPNKHDRKRTRQLFDALSAIGLLEPAGDEETWRPTAAAG